MAADKRRVVAVRVNAGNDTNGNPRRGWCVFSNTQRAGSLGGPVHSRSAWTDGYLGFLDEGYSGRSALTEKFSNVLELEMFPVTPAFYKRLLRGDSPGQAFWPLKR